MRFRALAAAASLLVAAHAASAQTPFSGFDVDRMSPTNARAAEAAFLASLTNFGTETFAGKSYANPFPLDFVPSGGTGQIDDPRFFAFFNTVSNLVGLQGANGLVTAFGGFGAAPIVVTFGGGTVDGFGFFASGLNSIGQGPNVLQLDYFNGATNVYSWLVSNTSTAQDNTMFLGLSGVAFDRVELRGQNGDGVWLNDLSAGTIASAVPEPASLALVATGLLLAAGVARRRRTR